MKPDENRGRAEYTLYWAATRPVSYDRTQATSVTLEHDEYRAAHAAVMWAQHGGSKVLPLLRLAQEEDKPRHHSAGLSFLLASIRDRVGELPDFQAIHYDGPPAQFERPTKLSVNKTLKQTDEALQELKHERKGKRSA